MNEYEKQLEKKTELTQEDVNYIKTAQTPTAKRMKLKIEKDLFSFLLKHGEYNKSK